MSKKNTELTQEEKSEFLDFLYTFNDILGIMDREDKIFDKILNSNLYNNPIPLSSIGYVNPHYDFDSSNPIKDICLKLDPEIKLSTFETIISESLLDISKEFEYGYYEDDVSINLELSFNAYSLFTSLKNKNLLDNKMETCPNKAFLETPTKVKNKKSKNPSI